MSYTLKKSYSYTFFKGLKILTIAGILSRIITFSIFITFARLLDPIDIALIPLIPSISMLCFAFLNLGIPTAFEKEVPFRLSLNENDGFRYLKTGTYWLLFASVLCGFGVWVFASSFAELFLKNSDRASLIKWLSLPITSYLILHVLSLTIQLREKYSKYAFLKIGGDVLSKLVGLAFFLIFNDLKIMLIGFAGGNIVLILLAIWWSRTFLFYIKSGIKLTQLIRQSYVYYLESNFNVFKIYGDNLLVAALIGPVELAGYYVAKRLADQLHLINTPIQASMTPMMSRVASEGKVFFNQIHQKIWISIPAILLLFGFYSCGAAPFIIRLIGGERYIDFWPVASVLCLATVMLFILNIEYRTLLVLGSTTSRFKVSLCHTFLIFVLASILAHPFGAMGIGLAMLFSTIISLVIAISSLKIIGVDKPNYGNVKKAFSVGVLFILCFFISLGFIEDILSQILLFSLLVALSSLLFFCMLKKSDINLFANYIPKKLLFIFEHLQRFNLKY